MMYGTAMCTSSTAHVISVCVRIKRRRVVFSYFPIFNLTGDIHVVQLNLNTTFSKIQKQKKVKAILNNKQNFVDLY